MKEIDLFSARFVGESCEITGKNDTMTTATRKQNNEKREDKGHQCKEETHQSILGLFDGQFWFYVFFNVAG